MTKIVEDPQEWHPRVKAPILAKAHRSCDLGFGPQRLAAVVLKMRTSSQLFDGVPYRVF